jgi:hypothetical protein
MKVGDAIGMGPKRDLGIDKYYGLCICNSRCFVPALRGKWIFNLMSMFAFVSILFTYYGVNFHLVGLHSYASGEAHFKLDMVFVRNYFVNRALAYPIKKIYKNNQQF